MGRFCLQRVSTTMNESEFQPEPYEELSPAFRYYSDAYYKKHSYIDMQIAAEKYVLSSGFAQDESEAARVVEEVFPYSKYGEGIDIGERIDVLSVLPLILGSRYVDTHFNIVKATEWYEETLKVAKDLRRSEHTPVCLESPYFAFSDASCLAGDHCPVITISKLLDETIFHTEDDMRGPDYANDNYHMRDLALMKQRLSVEYGYEDIELREYRVEAYQERFDKVFPFNN